MRRCSYLKPSSRGPQDELLCPKAKSKTEKQENLLGAIARGTTDGLHMALNIAAMLIAFLALIALADGILGGIHHWVAWVPESLETIFGAVFAPIAWVIGVPWRDCGVIGTLLGTRMVLNELVAFSMLGPMKTALDPRSFTIATFALCGFANLSSLESRSVASEHWHPTRRANWRGWAFARCWREPWRT